MQTACRGPGCLQSKACAVSQGGMPKGGCIAFRTLAAHAGADPPSSDASRVTILA